MKKLLQYLKGQFTFINKTSYLILLAGFILETTLVLTGKASLFAATAGLLGIICVIQTTSAKKLNWLTGIISSIMIGYIALTTHQIGIVFQQALYVVMLDLPMAFSKSWNNEKKQASPIKNKKELLKWILLYLLIACINFLLTTFIFGGTNNLLNAALFGLSMLAVIGTVLKKLFCYKLWIYGSVLSILIFTITAISTKSWDFALVASYAIYLANDGVALLSKKSVWNKRGEK
jgi:nicotinamide mononucleotide transporter